MPGKSRYGKGKHPHHSKKSKAKQRHIATALKPPVADTPQPATAISTPPPPKVPASPTKPRTAQYPYITAELRRISILAGIILVILIVLAVILS